MSTKLFIFRYNKLADNNEKTAFSSRLNHALDINGIPAKGKGRQVTVGKMFNVSQKAANKWLEGISLPGTMRIAVIAKKLSINVEWLTYGTGPINITSLPHDGNFQWKKVPLITWAQLKLIEGTEFPNTEKWAWTDVECGPRTFALKITDDSMMPRYEPGSTVIFDPDQTPKHRNIVIFKWKKTGDLGCAQLLIDGPNKYLKPHNPDYKTLSLSEGEPEINYCGTARQIFMTY